MKSIFLSHKQLFENPLPLFRTLGTVAQAYVGVRKVDNVGSQFQGSLKVVVEVEQQVQHGVASVDVGVEYFRVVCRVSVDVAVNPSVWCPVAYHGAVIVVMCGIDNEVEVDGAVATIGVED